MSRPFRLLAVGAATGALLLGTAGAASAATTAPTASGPQRGLDTLADALVCGGPLGGLLRQLVDCDPEDEPPFTSVPDGGF